MIYKCLTEASVLIVSCLQEQPLYGRAMALKQCC